VIQDNQVLNGPAQIGFPFRREEHATRTNIPSLPRNNNTITTTARDREWELKFEAPGSSLFHLVSGLILFPGGQLGQ
jgi:hypothetical protein